MIYEGFLFFFVDFISVWLKDNHSEIKATQELAKKLGIPKKSAQLFDLEFEIFGRFKMFW